ncbi:MAG: Rha family transcriptional regulator [Lachnospiraceae bacterium]|nr:Rha family transcriptional regulator [Lachnospiraceae bacterium]
MQELVKIIRNEPFTDSLVIAEGTGNQHESIQRRIRNYEKELFTFGKVGFEIRPMVSGQEMKVYLLNEQQATFLITLLKNTKIVVSFKLELVRQFYQMRQYLMEHQSSHWQATRLESKFSRRVETDEIKKFVAYAKSQGSQHAEKYYLTFSKLVNRMIGIEAGGRDKATAGQLNTLILMEHIIGEVIQDGIKQELFYKKIYQICKIRIEQFREIAYLTAVS